MATPLWSNEAKKMMLDLLLSGSGAVKAMLLSTTYTPNPDHGFVSDIVAHEIACTGYTGGQGGSGRKAVTFSAAARDDANNKATKTHSDIVWAAVGEVGGITTGYLAFILETGAEADSPVLSVHDCAKTLYGGSLTISPPAGGTHAIT